MTAKPKQTHLLVARSTRGIALTLSLGAALLALVAGAGIGSVHVAPSDVVNILLHKMFGQALPGGITPIMVKIGRASCRERL